jgi:hypothetical protein
MKESIIKEHLNNLFKHDSENYIFVYTPPKVGSTTVVSSLRVSLGKVYNVIHIHDEIMLSVLSGINDIKITEIIDYLVNNDKNVYVIDIYRTSVERKMSEYFEKISPYHFNNTEENINKYSLTRITDRFNKIFPYIGIGDHYFEKYNITPVAFDFNKKYTIQQIKGVKYIKLRLCDSNIWGSILSSIFGVDIVIIDDYTSDNKKIKELYNKFKNEYKIPSNLFDLIVNCKYLKFYYDEYERENYLNYWKGRISNEHIKPYMKEEYNFYMNLCLENQYINDIQLDHYIDEGCFCKLCSIQRMNVFLKAKSGQKIIECDKIIHKNIINGKSDKNIDFIKKAIQPLNSKKYDKNIFKIQL